MEIIYMACSMLHRLSVVMIAPFFLVSCGGGAGSDSPATSTISSSSSSAMKMEVINGITVPPEPDPIKNEATIQGVDVNTNGVRDDVERKIAVDSKSKSDFEASIGVSKILEKSVNGIDIYTIKNEMHLNYCKYKVISASQEIQALTLNTEERRLKYSETIKEIGGYNSFDFPECEDGIDDL